MTVNQPSPDLIQRIVSLMKGSKQQLLKFNNLTVIYKLHGVISVDKITVPIFQRLQCANVHLLQKCQEWWTQKKRICLAFTAIWMCLNCRLVGSTSTYPHFLDNPLTDGSQVVSLMRWQHFTPRKIPVTRLCSRLGWQQSHSKARRIRSIENVMT
jgi:hypothetical protein